MHTEESIDAVTLPDNRRHAPAIQVRDEPRRDAFGTAAEYFIARDEWIDTLPNAGRLHG